MNNSHIFCFWEAVAILVCLVYSEHVYGSPQLIPGSGGYFRDQSNIYIEYHECND